MPSLEEDLAARVARGEEVVLATVIKVDGEPPSRPGAKLLVSRTAALSGTLGCSEFDSAALADAGYLSPRPRVDRRLPGALHHGSHAGRVRRDARGSRAASLGPGPRVQDSTGGNASGTIEGSVLAGGPDRDE